MVFCVAMIGVCNNKFDNLEIKCKLDTKEYIDLVYAMYRSKRTPEEYKPYLEKILNEICE